MVPSTETSIWSDKLHSYTISRKFDQCRLYFSHVNMENLSIDLKNFECPLCFELFKDPMQIPCSNQHVICKMCCDKLFEITIFENGRNISRCYCREEIIVSDCVPAKAITRIINNISIRCPNSQNGCQWNCDAALDSVVRQNHVTDCR